MFELGEKYVGNCFINCCYCLCCSGYLFDSFIKEKKYQNDDEIFKFYYFLTSLAIDYEEKDKIIKLFCDGE